MSRHRETIWGWMERQTAIPDSPPFIPAIDTRKPWIDPDMIQYPWGGAWDHLAEAGKL